MVRKLTNVLAYLDERLGPHSGRGPEYHFPCPACIDRIGDESSKRKLGVNIPKAMGGCFRCGFAFRSFSQLFRYINGGRIRMEELALLRHEVALPKTDVVSAVRSRLVRKRKLTTLRSVPLPPEHVPLYELSVEERRAPRFRLPFSYLERRGVTEDRLKVFRIGYCGEGDYGQRLIFPVVQHGQVVYWTNRFCGNHRMKSKNPPNVDGCHQRGTCLLNYDNCLHFPRVALVEGPFSALAFQSAAFRQACAGEKDRRLDLLTPALAMMGKFLSNEQARLIAEMVPLGLQEIVIALDPGAGSESDEIASTLRSFVPKVSVLVLEDGDPDDLRLSLAKLLPGRRTPSVSDRVRQRLNG